MKNVTLLLAALFFTIVTALNAAEPLFGVKCGLALANQNFDYTNMDAPDFKYRSGLAAGVFTELFTDRQVSLIAEVDYVQKGFKDEQPETNETGPQAIGVIKENYRFDYLSIPVYAKLSWHKPVVAPYILVGFHYDYLLSWTTDKEWYDDIFNDYKKDDMGISLGIGGEYKISKYKVLLEARYSPGASYIYKTDLLKITNTSFEIMAGVQF